jgi:general secretion pathway protein G
MALVLLTACTSLPSQADKARRTQAKAQINAYVTRLEEYKFDTRSYPTTQQGLHALRVKPDDVKNWRGPYVQHENDTDPWHHPYIYKYPGDHGDKPDIICYGVDGKPGGEGLNADIVSWKN